MFFFLNILFLMHLTRNCFCSVFSVDDKTLVADDHEGGAFGPVAREMKIKNLRLYLFISVVNLMS